MQQLPIDVPKLIVTPIAQGRQKFGPYVGVSNIMIMHSVVDILGINHISRKIFDLAAGAITGMAATETTGSSGSKLKVAVTMYGNTTPLVMNLKNILEAKFDNIELIVFHPNGTGGLAMEKLISRGEIDILLDITPHEITDYLFGGLHAGNEKRLEAAAVNGLPQIITPGCLDFIVTELNKEVEGRKTYNFNPEFQLVKLTREEIKVVAEHMADKLNMVKAPTLFMIPLQGFSQYDKKGDVLYEPDVVRDFINTFKHLISNSNIEIIEIDAHINDDLFARQIADQFEKLMISGKVAKR